ncbi:MAG: agmatinase [Halobacteriovoraceae bacterium]|nr:agmatinase [Halobacteriovoraceae bacterium]MCB9095603.1 agmatinase [Halobacteriovoraceae bacterium]
MEFELERVPPFLGSEFKETIDCAGTYMIGITYDGTTSFRPGTRFGPNAIREATYGQEAYSMYCEKDLEDYPIFDLGNLPQYTSRFDRLKECFDSLFSKVNFQEQKIKVVTLGGEHSISQIPIAHYLRQYPNLVVLQLDAHADLREAYLDDPHSHASVMRRVWEMKSEKQTFMQYGIRSGTAAEHQFMKANNTQIKTKSELTEKLLGLPAKTPVYITLDLDFFDPCYLPGTGTPETGGANFQDFLDILASLKNCSLVGADVVELSPHIDPTGNSNSFAAKVMRELLLTMN